MKKTIALYVVLLLIKCTFVMKRVKRCKCGSLAGLDAIAPGPFYFARYCPFSSLDNLPVSTHFFNNFLAVVSDLFVKKQIRFIVSL